MKTLRVIAAVIGLGTCTTALNADTWNKRTKLTFSGPVQVPSAHSSEGVVTLPAGTYIFRLLDSSSARHIVQVTNVRGDKVYSTILAVNDYRANATSKTVMYFTERQSGTPQAVKAWFYPGDNFGQRFVYPKVKAAQIAAAVNQPVPSHEEATVTKEVVEAPIHIATPAKQETAYTAATFEKIDATDTAGVDGDTTPAPAPAAPATLPKTGSPLPLIGGLGVLLVAGSLLLRRARLAKN